MADTLRRDIDRAIDILRGKLRAGQEAAFCHQQFEGAGDRCLMCRVPRGAHGLLEVMDVLGACRRRRSVEGR